MSADQDKLAASKQTSRQEKAAERRHAATVEQTQREHRSSYPSDTPDETRFRNLRYAGSFHKLLPHNEFGLLTVAGEDPITSPEDEWRPPEDQARSPQPKLCPPQSGIENYEQLRSGLRLDDASAGFDDQALDGLRLLNRRPRNPDDPENPLPPRVLINQRSSKAWSIAGADTTTFNAQEIVYRDAAGTPLLLEEISLASPYTAAEMIEVYAMAVLRNVGLDAYGNPPDEYAEFVGRTISTLNNVSTGGDEPRAAFRWGLLFEYDLTEPNKADGKHRIVTADDEPVCWANLFRGPTPGDRAGPYLSAFLSFPRPPLFPSGCAPGVADLIGASQFAGPLGERLCVPKGMNRDFLRTVREYALVQNGYIPERYPSNFFDDRVPLEVENTRARELGNYVHVDNVYEEYIRAADILTGGQYPRSPVFPYSPLGSHDQEQPEPYNPNEGDGPTLGPPDAYALLGAVRGAAERAAFTQKWLVARRARPEVFGALIHLAMTGRRDLRDALSDALFEDPSATFLEEIAYRNARVIADRNEERIAEQTEQRNERNYLLSQMYPEGSPAHPAWPSGHATVAGACVTVLKAIFDETAKVRDADGKETPLTVGGELDKLASNIAFARNFAGVHFRTDGEHGILIGEEVAIRYLQDHLRTYEEEFRECDSSSSTDGKPRYVLTRRSGERICVLADSIRRLPPAPMVPLGFLDGRPPRTYRKANL